MAKTYDHNPSVRKDEMLETSPEGKRSIKPVETWCCPDHRIAVVKGEIPRSEVVVSPASKAQD